MGTNINEVFILSRAEISIDEKYGVDPRFIFGAMLVVEGGVGFRRSGDVS